MANGKYIIFFRYVCSGNTRTIGVGRTNGKYSLFLSDDSNYSGDLSDFYQTQYFDIDKAAEYFNDLRYFINDDAENTVGEAMKMCRTKHIELIMARISDNPRLDLYLVVQSVTLGIF